MATIDPSRQVLFVQYANECDGQAVLIALDGRDVPDHCELRFSNQSNAQKLVYDFSIAITGQSDFDRETNHLRTLALGNFVYRFVTEFQTDAFECLAVTDKGPIEESRFKVVVRLLVQHIFDLPLFQLAILKSSHDALVDQPFLAPLTTEQLRMARSIPIQSGDCLIIEHLENQACLKLRTELGDGVFEADLFVFAKSQTLMKGERLTSCIRSRFEALDFRIKSEVAEVVSLRE